MISFFVSLIAYVWFLEYFGDLGIGYLIISVILLFALLLGHVLFIIWVVKKRFKKYGLECPNCKKPIYASLAQIAVATGKCGECGATII